MNFPGLLSQNLTDKVNRILDTPLVRIGVGSITLNSILQIIGIILSVLVVTFLIKRILK